MRPRIATITGAFLAPGVSKNARLYSEGNIQKAVARMSARLSDPTADPIVMMSHHAAGDDSTKIAARVTAVELSADGKARWTADVPDTSVGRDMAALAATGYLPTVSIRGRWVGDVRTEKVEVNGNKMEAETADDLEIDGIDFTKSPGVSGARIDSTTVHAESVVGGTASGTGVILESAVDVELVEVEDTHADLKGSDFVFPAERAFAVMEAADVKKAVADWGGYRGKRTFEQFRTSLAGIAERKGLSEALPEGWAEAKDMRVVLLPGSTRNDVLERIAQASGLNEFYEANYSADDIKAMIGKGQAMPDGSMPVASVSDLKAWLTPKTLGSITAAQKAFLIKRAKALGAANLLPSSWGVQQNSADPVDDATRAVTEARAALEAAQHDLLERQAERQKERQAPMAEETKAPEGAATLSETDIAKMVADASAKAVTEALAAQAKATADAKAAKKAAKAATKETAEAAQAKAAKKEKAAVKETTSEPKGLSEADVAKMIADATSKAVAEAVTATTDSIRAEIVKTGGIPKRKGLVLAESLEKKLADKNPWDMSADEWDQAKGEATLLALVNAPTTTLADLQNRY